MTHARGRNATRRRPAEALVRGGAQVTEHRLRNGLHVLIAERHADPIVASVLFYRVGAAQERDHEAGVSHFLEHMMFKGSAGYPKGEVDRVTTLLGGQNNAFTGHDHTAYWFEFASDRWEHALEMEADRVRRLNLDARELDAEREVVLEEIAMGHDDPWRAVGEQVETLLFPRHPYGRPVLGYPETLAAMTPDSVRAYYDRYYRPDNATLVVCGDVRPAAAMRAIRTTFGALEGPDKGTPPRLDPPVPRAPAGEHRVTLRWDDPGKRLLIGWPGAAVGTDDDFALDVVDNLLTSGRLSRLHRSLVVQHGVATSVSSYNDARVHGGAFWLYVDANPEADPDDVERLLDSELQKMRDELVQPDELKRTKAILVAGEAHDSETVSEIAENLGEFAVDADWRMALDGCARQRRVTASQVRSVCARMLDPRRRVTGWCLPEDAPVPAGARRNGAAGKRG